MMAHITGLPADKIMFFFFGGVALLFSLLMMTRKNPLSAAICLIVTLASVAGLYILLNATFVALLQILVYAGAIMMLIIFVIMTVNLREEELALERPVIFGSIVALISVIVSFKKLKIAFGGMNLSFSPDATREMGSIRSLGTILFAKHTLAFEIVSVLLTVALIGIVVFAQKGGKRSGLLENEDEVSK